jgi:hypothetical protein
MCAISAFFDEIIAFRRNLDESNVYDQLQAIHGKWYHTYEC